MRKKLLSVLPAVLLLAGFNAHAQQRQRIEILDSKRPEAWAMNYLAATSFMTGFGQTPSLEWGQWEVSAELGEIPHLSAEQQRVGLNGFKHEDLNKSPAFGRLRLLVGLPGKWVAELGYTPPVSIDGAKPHDVFALGIGRRVLERNNFTLSARAFGQHGNVTGDITCDRGLAGVADPAINPFGCQAPSNDRFKLNYYGADVTGGWNTGPWHLHGTVGAVRTELEAEFNAITTRRRASGRLVANDVLPFIAAGLNRDLTEHWSVGGELLYVPLTVQRNPQASSEHDSLTSLRLRISYKGH